MSALDMFPETRIAKPNDLDLRYTTRETLDYCKKLAGVTEFDLDVAADQESHHAPLWFDVQADGLSLPWFGRVWCNPPFSDVPAWVAKARTELDLAEKEKRTMTIAQLLPCNRTEQPWWQEQVEPVRDRGLMLRTHFLPQRTRFGHPGNPEGVGVGSPPFGCVLLVWRR